MKDHLSVLFLSVFLLASCGRAERTSQANTNPVADGNKEIIIINRTKNASQAFMYWDNYDNSFLSNFSKSDSLRIRTNTPIVSYISYKPDFSDLRYYMFKPGDVIYVDQKNGNEVIFNAAETSRKPFIELMGKIHFNINSWNWKNNGNYGQAVLSSDASFAARRSIVDSATLVNDSDKKFLNDEIRYDNIAAQIALATRFRRKDLNIKDILASSNITAWRYLTFRNVIYNYTDYLTKVKNLRSIDSFLSDFKTNLPKDVSDLATYNYLKKLNVTSADQLDTVIDAAGKMNTSPLVRELADYLIKNAKNKRLNFDIKNADSLFVRGQDSSQPIAFEDLLQKYKGKIIYLDFWASWCGPCLAEIPNSLKLSQELGLTHKDIVFLYLSIDQDLAAWQAKTESMELPRHRSFIMLQNQRFEGFTKNYKLSGIPRYMIVDKNGKIVNQDAPRPSDKTTENLLKSF